jgi:hypothetical protein
MPSILSPPFLLLPTEKHFLFLCRNPFFAWLEHFIAQPKPPFAEREGKANKCVGNATVLFFFISAREAFKTAMVFFTFPCAEHSKPTIDFIAMRRIPLQTNDRLRS